MLRAKRKKLMKNPRVLQRSVKIKLSAIALAAEDGKMMTAFTRSTMIIWREK
jgi:hypothetical protein